MGKILVMRSDWSAEFPYAEERDALFLFFETLFPEAYRIDCSSHSRNSTDELSPFSKKDDWLFEKRPDERKSILVLNFTIPDHFLSLDHALCAGYILGESDTIPSKWIENIRKMNFLCVSSRWQGMILKREIPEAIVSVFPIPLFEKTISHMQSSIPLIDVDGCIVENCLFEDACVMSDLKEEGPVFLFLMDFFSKNGFAMMISEWFQYKRDGGEGILIVDLFRLPREGSDPSIAWGLIDIIYRIMRRNDLPSSKIFLVPQNLSIPERRSLQMNCDALVVLPMGYGISGRISEALTTGKPLIMPNNPAMETYIPKEYPLVFSGRSENCVFISKTSLYPLTYRWWIPLEGEMARTMNRLSSLSPMERDKLGKSLRENAERFCSMDALSSELASIVGKFN